MILMQQRWMLIYCFLMGSFMNFGCAVAQPWQLEDLSVTQNTGQLTVTASKALYGQELFQNISYKCPQVVPMYPSHNCLGAEVTFDWQQRHWQADMSSQFDFESGQGFLQANLFNDQVSLNWPLDGDAITITLEQMALNALSDWLPDFITQAVSGLFDGPVTFNLSEMKLSASGMGYAEIEGGYGDDFFVSQLSGQLGFEAKLSTLDFNVDIAINQGEALIGPVYVNFSQYPVHFNIQMGLDGLDGWSIHANVQQSESLAGELDLVLTESGEVQSAEMEINVLDAMKFNKHVSSAVLELYGFKKSEMEGQFNVTMSYDGHQISLGGLSFTDFYFQNTARKLSVAGLNGQINWQHKEGHVSELNWQSLLLAGMPVGESGVTFDFFADELRVIGQPEWPVFDGTIAVQEWHISQLFSDFVDMEISAEIMPISLALVTEKMGWPLMMGSLSGKIPAVIKKGPVIELKGGLDLNVFEGKMRVNQLSTERLFGVAPVIAGDVAFEQLNLGQLTDTFDFGRITGLLSGTVDDLRITNWKADRLKAEIYTVEQKGVKQTISQQAIDHISSIGGIQGALSRTFLRFFDDFKYKKIKLSCVLQNSVCQIGGLNNTSKQFTIVEGGGIPKINIVGFVRQVDWDTFISRLLNASYEG